MNVGDEVLVPDIGDGTITSIHKDDRGEPIYTVTLEEPTATPTGYYLARACELKVRVTCDQCQMLSINGVACHETGCPNMGARWDVVDRRWVKQRECSECGFDVDADDPCCSAEPEDES